MASNYQIFVSIASYKDPELVSTIEDLYTNAENPDQIRVVVFNQTDFEVNNDHLLYRDDRQVEVISVDYRNTKGVAWARHKIQSYIEHERYYLQIDAHMRFAEHWDSKMISYLHAANSTKPVLAFYPSGYNNERGKYESNIIINQPRALNRRAVTSQGIGLGKEACAADHGDDKPIPGTTYAAGFCFAPIEYVKEVGYDPQLFWNYEETDQTLRAFTNGWTFFGTPECLIWHKYNTTGTATHFKESRDLAGYENASNEHAEYKYFSGEYKGPYALGTKRTLKEFEILNNINFDTQTLGTKESKDMIIVVPYRDRERDLEVYLQKVPEYFKTQNITYDILITELDPVGEWNAGLVVNTVYNFLKKADYRYIYVHHVDVYPEEGTWIFPAENEVFSNIGDAGSCLTTVKNFLKVGGYRNTFWGWGAEDDDIYRKFAFAGISNINVNFEPERFSVKYNTDFQDHPRPFIGKNYGGNIYELSKPSNRNINSIFDVNKYCETHSLEQIGENIYRQKVHPLVSSPLTAKNKNLVLGVIANLKFEDIVPFVKTATIYGTNEFDTVILDASIEVDPEVEKEVQAFGCTYVRVAPMEGDLFTDRYKLYKEYLQNVEYDNIIFTDVSDVYFQDNPFKHYKYIESDQIVFASEGITINDSEWNRGALQHLYDKSVVDAIGPYEVLCCGVIGGKKDALLDFIDKYLEERKRLNRTSTPVRGEDQPIIQKMLYGDQSIKRFAYRSNTPYAVHLHAPIYQPSECRFVNDIRINHNSVRTVKNELISIVHQYNRSAQLHNTVRNHYRQYFITLANS